MASHHASTMKATRRARGAPRVLLIDAARTLFAQQDYRSTTTREIAETAGVLEPLLFRQFGSKAALFHEAVVVPFLQVVADLNTRWELFEPGPESSEALAREFLGALYDMFVENRGLVMTLWTADALTDEELAETGIVEIDQALALLGELGGKGADLLQIGRRPMEISARSTVAMVAGMAAFSSTFFGGQRPPRDEVVDELVQANLHGFLHRQARDSGVAGTATGDTHA